MGSVDELLEMCPARARPWKRDRQGLAVVLVPRFRRGLLARWLQPRLKGDRRFVKLHLDRVGSFVWERADGQTPVSVIADALAAEFGAAVEPRMDRLEVFVRQLLGGGLLRPEGDADSTGPLLGE